MALPKTEGAQRGTIQGTTSGGHVSYTIRAMPLPQKVANFLLANARTIKRLLQRDRPHQEGDQEASAAAASGEVLQQSSGEVRTDVFFEKLDGILTQCGPQWRGLVDRIWSLGPRRTGPNLLVDMRGEGLHYSLQKRIEGQRTSTTPAVDGGNGDEDSAARLAAHMDAASLADAAGENNNAPNGKESSSGWGLVDVEEALDTGFQLATLQGPMCAEPMQGMVYFVEKIEIASDSDTVNHSQLTSATITSVREACRNGLLDWSPRLMLAMYTCDIQASTEVLGKVHGVLSRRRGRITSEEMKEGTSFFTVGALLPVVESFGFADGACAAEKIKVPLHAQGTWERDQFQLTYHLSFLLYV